MSEQPAEWDIYDGRWTGRGEQMDPPVGTFVDFVKRVIVSGEVSVTQSNARVSCATCKWAGARKQRATKLDPRKEILTCTNPELVNAIGFDESTGWCDAETYLEVSPTFGCVQWEAK